VTKKTLQHYLIHGNDRLTSGQRATHTYVIGQPGTGKSRALESWIMQDIVAGRGVGVIDPHGDLFGRLVLRISDIPRVWEKVVIIDPCDPRWTVNFNPLAAIGDISQERLSLFLTDVMIKIWGLDTASSPRMIWLLTNTFLALASLRLSLLDINRFLMDTPFRESLLPRIYNHQVRAFFEYEFPKNPGAIHQWVTPVLNKIGGLIFDPDIRPLLAKNARIDFRSLMDDEMTLLVNLPKGIIGENSSALLGAFIVAHLQKAALSRANQQHRPPFYLYLDEFQNYTTKNIQDILSESRKYALPLILAHQYLDQLTSDLRSAVLNTSGTLASFRVGYKDAKRLAREIFPAPNYLTRRENRFSLKQIGGFPVVAIKGKEKPFGWDGLAQVLSQLPHRVLWIKHRGQSNPIRIRSMEMPNPILTSELKFSLRKLVDFSGSRFGCLKRDVQREVDDKYKTIIDGSFTDLPAGSISIWSD
jgi:hypothetical protein